MLDSLFLSLISNEHLKILSTFYFINTNKSSIHIFRISDQFNYCVTLFLYTFILRYLYIPFDPHIVLFL